MTTEQWTMVGAMAGAGATVALVLVAWAQLASLRAQARRADRAHVIVTSEGDRETHALNFVIANVGRTYATDITIEWNQTIEAKSSHTSRFEDPALWNPPFMSPGEVFRTVLDMSHKRAGTDLPMSYEARVSWKSPTTDLDEIFNETYTVDFRRFYAQREWNLVDQQPQKLLNALDGIASAIDRLADDGDARPPSIEDTLGLGLVSKALGSEEE